MPKGQRDVLLGLVLLLAAGAGGAYLMLQKPEPKPSPGAGKVYPAPLVPFDGQQAMKYLQQICDLGPRVSGTASHAKMVELAEKHFKEHGLTVTRQVFEAKQRSKLNTVTMTNLIAQWKPEKKVRLLICTHYDTRPLADREKLEADWKKPFVAANDGAAGVAFMMEMAQHLKELDPELGIDFVCFDGEEFIFDNRQSDQGGDIYFLGSRHFADEYAKRLSAGGDPWFYKEAVLLDMPAGINARFLMEGESMKGAREVMEKIWKIADEQGVKNFVIQRGRYALDDHLELQRVGIKAIDIIPILPDNNEEPNGLVSYPHWHKLTDVPENCSGETLANVAKVLSVWMKTSK
ncbi:MAG TPA: M28 family peptidase [Gemmatales bacterium]|nr:M28 family peptidase [Gemmatales bacterium]